MQKADYLLRLMKQQTDALVATDEKLQQFLMWVNEKSLSVKVPYKPAAIRAFYLGRNYLGRKLDRIRTRTSYFDFDTNAILDLASTIDPAFQAPIFLFFDLTIADDNEFDCDFAIDIVLDLAIAYALDLAIPYIYAAASARNLVSVLTFAANFNLEPELKQSLQQFKDKLYYSKDTKREQEWWKREREWWQVNGYAWTEKLRAVMIKHRNIGQDWQFSEQQQEFIRQYYDANLLLVDCLNSSCNVTPAVRSHIEDTLLLPIAEIEKTDSCQDK